MEVVCLHSSQTLEAANIINKNVTMELDRYLTAALRADFFAAQSSSTTLARAVSDLEPAISFIKVLAASIMRTL